MDAESLPDGLWVSVSTESALLTQHAHDICSNINVNHTYCWDMPYMTVENQCRHVDGDYILSCYCRKRRKNGSAKAPARVRRRNISTRR